MKRFHYWILGGLLAIGVTGLAIWLPRFDEPLLSTVDSWKHVGSFERGEPDDRVVYSDGMDKLYWVATHHYGNGSGRLVSKAFEAPGWISLTVTGDLTSAGNNI